ncbi:MAG: hypothetical protein AB8G05_02295 [Oligoflexales bacterium]
MLLVFYKRLLKLLSVFFLIHSPLSFGAVKKVSSPNPVLYFHRDMGSFPLLQQALRDPKIYLGRKITTKELDGLNRKIKFYRENLRSLKGVEYLNSLRDYLSILIKYSYYWGDVLSGHGKSSIPEKKLRKILYRTHMKIKKIGAHLHKLTKNRREKRWIWLHICMIDYLYPKLRKNAVDRLKKLVRMPFEFDRKNLMNFAISIYEVGSSNPILRAKSLEVLDRIYNELPKKASLLAHLVLSKAFIGISNEGKSIGGFSQSYRQHLQLVSSLCRNMSDVEKTDVLRYMLAVWMHAKDFKNNWKSLPFKHECFKSLPDMLAVEERLALMEWKHGNLGSAKNIYQRLVSRITNKKEKDAVEERVIDLLALIYKENQDPFAYQKYLVDAEKAKHGTHIGARLQNLHYKLLFAEFRKVQMTKDPELIITIVEPLMARYLNTQSADFRSQRLKIKLADLYSQFSLHKKAENLYGDISQESKGEKKKKFLKKQIQAASYLAKWPIDDPWKFKRGLVSKERDHLLRLYYGLFQLEKSLNWQVSSHIGLLEIDLGRVDKAHFVWQNAIKAHSKGKAPRKAMGTLMKIAEQQKQWQKLEDIVYISMEKNIVPLVNDKVVSVRDKLEESLYFGALTLKDQKKPNLAIKKLVTLENTYTRSPKYSEYLYLLAQCYKAEKEYDKSLEVLELILALKKSVPYYRQALLNAAGIRTGMADVAGALKLYQHFLVNFKNAAEVDGVKKSMIDIFLGQSEYSNAKNMLLTIDMNNLPKDEREKLGELIFYTTLKEDNYDNTINLARKIIAQKQYSQLLQIRSYGILAESLYQKNNSHRLSEIENALLAMDQNVMVVSDKLSFIWYLKAKILAESKIRSFKKVLTQDFANVVPFLDSSYRQIKKSFKAVCQVKQAAYCVPSMQDVLIFNKKVSSFLADIAPESYLDAKKREEFDSERKELKERLKQDYAISKKDALVLLEHGNTNPKVTKSLLWQNERDWNFRLGNESGTGFMQLSKDYIKGQSNEVL